MSSSFLAVNGIDAETGEYLTAGLTSEDAATLALGRDVDELGEDRKALFDKISRGEVPHWGTKEGIDPTDLGKAGWGVVFAKKDPDWEGCREALQPLLELRRQQAGPLFREYSGVILGYDDGDTELDFLRKRGKGPGPADPEKVPYYLLIVGSPSLIPYRFQYQLDVTYAVGRLHFDSLEEYAAYAQAVVDAESGRAPRSRTAQFFGVRNANDAATSLSADHLITPLAAKLESETPEWSFEVELGERATKARLGEILRSADGPGLLFTASHGMGFRKKSDEARETAGALICQDWPGPQGWNGPIGPDFCFRGEDLDDGGSVRGMISFHFACFGGGTPHMNDFPSKKGKHFVLSEEPFVARLPQRLLGRGGALAAIGHVERAWPCSFIWDGAGEQITVFESALKALMAGKPVGAATEYLNQRYAELSSHLSTEIEEIDRKPWEEDSKLDLLASLWTANNDARSYVVVGDPAVRIPAEASRQAPRETGAATVVRTQAEPAAPPSPAADRHRQELHARLESLREQAKAIESEIERLERELEL